MILWRRSCTMARCEEFIYPTEGAKLKYDIIKWPYSKVTTKFESGIQ